MKVKFSLCALVSLCFFSMGDALIIETSDLSSVFTHLEENTLYVFDLDNTLIEAAQHLGSDQWVVHQLNHLTKQGISLDDALNQVLPRWVEVQHRTMMQLVDPMIPDLLHQLHEKQVPVIALTQRFPEIAERTLQQLMPLQIDLSKTAHFEGSMVFEELGRTEYREGIIFLGRGIDKGTALLAYLQKLHAMPSRIVVIDDKLKHLQNIAHSIEPLGIDFVGIRFGGADEKVMGFNPKIAEVQWEHFYRILSDEQALHLLQLDTQPESPGG